MENRTVLDNVEAVLLEIDGTFSVITKSEREKGALSDLRLPQKKEPILGEKKSEQ